MEEKAYHYAQMEPKQLDKLRQAEKDLGQFDRAGDCAGRL